jgi:hypothetical protein
MDDFAGKFCNEGKHPLIKLVKSELNGYNPPNDININKPGLETTSTSKPSSQTSSSSTSNNSSI